MGLTVKDVEALGVRRISICGVSASAGHSRAQPGVALFARQR